ncbi:MAG: radical SAM protein [Gracilibacter sp. BRH_c7a]|nr:MAG: radical SAM protein [Gracilibacter sp. BRH_c7a]
MNLKNYNISKNIHIYEQGNLRIAYDVNSGSLHTLDKKTYSFIKEMIESQRSNPLIDFNLIGQMLSDEDKEEILEELEQLQRHNLLFSEEAGEQEPIYISPPIIKAMCLHVAHDCNLRCGYCFAGTGLFGGCRELMSLETGREAIDYLLKHSGSRPQCEVDFFGGEPLMNLAVVKELISYGKMAAKKVGKRIKFTLTTNAILLDEPTASYLEKEEVSVVLSLDGRKEVNDRMRPFSNGKGSYDRIVPNILRAIKKRPNTSPYAIGNYYYVRGTYTRHNTDFHLDVLHMADLGIKRISVEPVVASPEDDFSFSQEDIQKVKESYDILGEKVLEYSKKNKEFTFFHFNAGLDDGPCLPKRLSGCGAGHEYIAVSPEGSIYPCHQFVGQEEYKLGSLHEPDSGLRTDLVEKFRNTNIYAKEDCRTCWARFSCSGGCHAANVSHSGELTKVYPLGCELQKKRLEVAYYLKIKETLAVGTNC